MPVKRYVWSPGSHVRIDAQRAGEEMEQVRASHNGRLEPDMLVEAARDPRSALHAHFEWDEATAARNYWSEQAAQLIRFLRVEVDAEAQDDEARIMRAYVNVEVDGDRHYTSIETALSSDELRAQVLERAWRELRSWQERHRELVEFARVCAAIDKTAKQLKK